MVHWFEPSKDSPSPAVVQQPHSDIWKGGYKHRWKGYHLSVNKGDASLKLRVRAFLNWMWTLLPHWTQYDSACICTPLFLFHSFQYTTNFVSYCNSRYSQLKFACAGGKGENTSTWYHLLGSTPPLSPWPNFYNYLTAHVVALWYLDLNLGNNESYQPSKLPHVVKNNLDKLFSEFIWWKYPLLETGSKLGRHNL